MWLIIRGVGGPIQRPWFLVAVVLNELVQDMAVSAVLQLGMGGKPLPESAVDAWDIAAVAALWGIGGQPGRAVSGGEQLGAIAVDQVVDQGPYGGALPSRPGDEPLVELPIEPVYGLLAAGFGC